MLQRSKKITLFIFGLFSVFAFAHQPQTTSKQHVIVSPQCLLKKLQADYIILSSAKDFSLITISDKDLDQLIEAKNHGQSCGGFRDVTRAWTLNNLKNNVDKNQTRLFLSNYINPMKPSLAISPSNYSIKYEKQVNQLIPQLNTQNLWSDLMMLTNYADRYSRSNTGVAASDWIASEIKKIAKNNHRDDVTIYKVKTGWWYKQKSVIAKIGNLSEPGIVIGAHMDTLSLHDKLWRWSLKPGADDDATGTTTLLEVARVLLANDMHFKKPVYFIWYAAEEVGLVGSDYVVADFKKKKIPVSAVMQLDMTGYAHQGDPSLWLMNDYVDKSLTEYVAKLIATYVKQPIKYSECGYACSDHATWTQNGIAAVMPSEAAIETINPDIHSSNDTMDKLSISHMVDYAKLAIAFLLELAEPKED